MLASPNLYFSIGQCVQCTVVKVDDKQPVLSLIGEHCVVCHFVQYITKLKSNPQLSVTLWSLQVARSNLYLRQNALAIKVAVKNGKSLCVKKHEIKNGCPRPPAVDGTEVFDNDDWTVIHCTMFCNLVVIIIKKFYPINIMGS